MEISMTIPTSFKSAARTALLGTLALGAFGTLAAFAQETAPEVVEAAAPIIDKGDVAWMMTSCALVLFMTIPGLALFYGGLVRAKNMLSVLMQCTVIASVMMIVWILWGYSMAFGGGTSPFWGGLGKVFLAGVTTDTTSATFTDGVVLPEYLFITFQMTFAAITPALIVGAFAERIKFRAVVLFSVLWGTFVYFPVAHMVWDGAGYIFNLGAIDFACFFVGKRLGYGKDNMAPHSMTLTMVGASMLWVGWFGFNVGSNLEATAGATLAMINTFVCTAAAVLSWSAVESMIRGKASMLGAASGMVAGLVAITPACGTIGPVGAIVLGIVVSPVCYFFVATVKGKFGYDDSLDVFGIHGIGGILGALGTGVLTAPGLGGTGGEDFSIGGQVWIQFVAIVITIVWCGVISAILYKVVDLIVGLRPTEEAEREGLDLTSHGEVAYHS
jgi:ammonium transporter, Amt family